MNEFLTAILTAFGAVIVFGVLGFTPAVYPENTERAEQVCKNGEWVEINNKFITCKDGAKYPRREK